jgi:hypothetical protein
MISAGASAPIFVGLQTVHSDMWSIAPIALRVSRAGPGVCVGQGDRDGGYFLAKPHFLPTTGLSQHPVSIQDVNMPSHAGSHCVAAANFSSQY